MKKNSYQSPYSSLLKNSIKAFHTNSQTQQTVKLFSNVINNQINQMKILDGQCSYMEKKLIQLEQSVQDLSQTKNIILQQRERWQFCQLKQKQHKFIIEELREKIRKMADKEKQLIANIETLNEQKAVLNSRWEISQSKLIQNEANNQRQLNNLRNANEIMENMIKKNTYKQNARTTIKKQLKNTKIKILQVQSSDLFQSKMEFFEFNQNPHEALTLNNKIQSQVKQFQLKFESQRKINQSLQQKFLQLQIKSDKQRLNYIQQINYLKKSLQKEKLTLKQYNKHIKSNLLALTAQLTKKNETQIIVFSSSIPELIQQIKQLISSSYKKQKDSQLKRHTIQIDQLSAQIRLKNVKIEQLEHQTRSKTDSILINQNLTKIWSKNTISNDSSTRQEKLKGLIQQLRKQTKNKQIEIDQLQKDNQNLFSQYRNIINDVQEQSLSKTNESRRLQSKIKQLSIANKQLRQSQRTYQQHLETIKKQFEDNRGRCQALFNKRIKQSLHKLRNYKYLLKESQKRQFGLLRKTEKLNQILKQAKDKFESQLRIKDNKIDEIFKKLSQAIIENAVYREKVTILQTVKLKQDENIYKQVNTLQVGAPHYAFEEKNMIEQLNHKIKQQNLINKKIYKENLRLNGQLCTLKSNWMKLIQKMGLMVATIASRQKQIKRLEQCIKKHQRQIIQLHHNALNFDFRNIQQVQYYGQQTPKFNPLCFQNVSKQENMNLNTDQSILQISKECQKRSVGVNTQIQQYFQIGVLTSLASKTAQTPNFGSSPNSNILDQINLVNSDQNEPINGQNEGGLANSNLFYNIQFNQIASGTQTNLDQNFDIYDQDQSINIGQTAEVMRLKDIISKLRLQIQQIFKYPQCQIQSIQELPRQLEDDYLCLVKYIKSMIQKNNSIYQASFIAANLQTAQNNTGRSDEDLNKQLDCIFSSQKIEAQSTFKRIISEKQKIINSLIAEKSQLQQSTCKMQVKQQEQDQNRMMNQFNIYKTELSKHKKCLDRLEMDLQSIKNIFRNVCEIWVSQDDMQEDLRDNLKLYHAVAKLKDIQMNRLQHYVKRYLIIKAFQ